MLKQDLQTCQRYSVAGQNYVLIRLLENHAVMYDYRTDRNIEVSYDLISPAKYDRDEVIRDARVALADIMDEYVLLHGNNRGKIAKEIGIASDTLGSVIRANKVGMLVIGLCVTYLEKQGVLVPNTITNALLQ